jgi:hypothetical protein
MLIPFAFLVTALPRPVRGGPAWSAWAPALGGWLLSLVWALRLASGVRAGVWAVVHLAVLAVPLARSALAGEEGWPARAVAGWRRRAAAWTRPGGPLAGARRQRLAWVAAPFLLALLRAALLLVGVRESLTPGGVRLALSLLHLPLALALEAGYLVWLGRRLEAEDGLVPADLLPALALLLGAWLLPAALVSDLGLALLEVPVLLVALVWVLAAAGALGREGLAAGARRRAGAPARRLAQWAPVVALVLALGFVASPAMAKGAVSLVPAGWRVELESERNYLRLLAFAYPGELARVARRESEELAVMAAVMRRYTTGPLAGRGWFASEISPHLAATALREHAPAVFVAAEQGAAGALGLLLLYGAAALAAPPLAPWARPGLERGPPGAAVARALGALAALSFALPSAYMVLANYQLTLFTGKNAYLLGLDSTADLLEAALLSSLVALAVAVARDEGDR